MVDARLEIASQKLGYRLEYHSVEEVNEFARQMEAKHEEAYESARSAASQSQFYAKTFAQALHEALNNPARPLLSPEEVRWMENERELSRCDAAYWITRYYWIKNDKNEFQRFTFRPAQMVYFNIVAELEARGLSIELLVDKARQLGLCLHPSTRVLMADFTWKALDEVQRGDRIIGCDEFADWRHGRALHESVVEAKREVWDEPLTIILEDGRKLVATPKHRFLTKGYGNNRSGVETYWRQAGELKVGDVFRHVCQPFGQGEFEDGWFGGLLDGEGCIRSKHRGGGELCISQVEGPVLDRARDYLTSRGYAYREEWDRRKGGDKSKLGNKPVAKLVINRLEPIFRLLGTSRPVRMLKSKWWEGKELPGKRDGAWVRIVSIERSEVKQRMIDLQTSTKTFIAEGIVSHNSTETEGFICHRVCLHYGTNATIASYDQAKTAEMAKMMFLAYDMMPWWMIPLHTRRVESDRGMLMFGGQRSGVLFQHGTQTSGISQGTTPTVYHLSEVAYYPDCRQLIEIGLYKAVHPSPKVFGVLESTAAGDVGWWPDKYWYYKRNWPRCRMMSLFLPWFMATDDYPNETWLRQNPVPGSWRPSAEAREMHAKARAYVGTNEVLAKVLGPDWDLTPRQVWWWETQFKEARDGGQLKDFYQEYPTDDRDSFQGSYESVFGREVIAEVDSRRARDYQTFAIIGQSVEIENEPHPDDVDYTRPRLDVKFASPRGDVYRWEFVPLLWRENWADVRDIREAEIPNGIFMRFREPEPGYDYCVGVDTSTGVGDESTVVAVSRRAREEGEPDVQVAEFRSNMIGHVEAYPYVMAIAAYYSKYMGETTLARQPLVAIEQVAAVGDTVYKDMWKMGYSRFFRMTRYDTKPSRQSKSKSFKMGWFSFSWSRPILIGNFIAAARNGWYQVNSPWTIWEMAHFETHTTGSGKTKEMHSEDSTDDGIFANAMAYFCPNDLKSLNERHSKKYVTRAGESYLPEIDLGEFEGEKIPTRPGKHDAPDWVRELEVYRG